MQVDTPCKISRTILFTGLLIVPMQVW
jgi:hypothetical protein